MKRSFQLIVSLVFVGSSLSAVAGCPCAGQRKQLRAKRVSGEMAAPATETAPMAQPAMAQPMAQPAPMQMAPAAPAPAPVKMAPAAPAPASVKMAPVAAPAPMAQVPAMENNKIDLVNQADFDAHVTKHTNVVAVFSTTWCGPCKTLKPILDELRNENKQIMFVYVDGDNFPGLVSKNKIIGFPTLKFLKNGKEVGQAVGGQSKDELQSAINQYLLGGTPTFVMSSEPAEQVEPEAKRMKVEAPAPAPVKAAPAPAAQVGNRIDLTSAADFAGHIAKNANVVAVFSTTWCGPCKALKPVLEELSGINKHVTFVYVDGDNFPGLVSKYAKIGFPTLKFFKGGKEVGQAIGGQSKEELQSMINTKLGK